jgi:TetR/AcrR family transcriptional repressor of mexJK operon
MEHLRETRWDHKHKIIVAAATTTFMSKGYAGTSMDDIAAAAAVSKQTVYKHFADKEQLFADVVLATTDRVTDVVRLVSAALPDSDLEQGISELARTLLATLMRPELLRLRRLVVATADLFPGVGAAWYEQGFGRVLAALAERFRDFANRGLIQAGDPLLAAHHFVGLLLWIPVNRAMFTGDYTSAEADLNSYADAAASAFLRAYAVPAGSRGTRMTASGAPRP